MSFRKSVNCRTDYRFQADIRTPNAAGDLAQPAAGAVTGILFRLSATEGGPAIHANVDNLATAEASGRAGRFFVVVDTALLVTHVLGAVGHGGVFYRVVFKAGEIEKESTPFRAIDGQLIT